MGGRRLPSEVEFHRAAYGTPSGTEYSFSWGDEQPDMTPVNFYFQQWDPTPDGTYSAGQSAWESTSCLVTDRNGL
jgi:formylglycine-generating enzyme required for sulfatase activity